MSTTQKTPRLLAAAKEFNIGKATLLEYLTNKGFAVTDSPAFKLTEGMYDALTNEFAQDKAVKRRSDEIALPKSSGERKKEPEAVAPKKAEPAPVAKPEPVAEQPKPVVKETPPTVEVKEEPVAAPKETPKKETPKAKPEPVAAAPEPSPAPAIIEPVAKPAPVAEPEPEKPKTVKKAAPVVEEAEEEESHIEVKAPKLGGPNILGKINLEDLNQSTRPKKGTKKAAAPIKETPVVKEAAKKKKETPKAEEEPVASPEVPVQKAAPKKQEPKPTPVAEVPAPAPVEEKPAVTPTQTEDDNKPEHIEMKAPQLTGPKIIGRIELPVNDPSKSGGGNSANGRRDRKRIPIQKKPDNRPTGTGAAAQGGQQGQGGGFNRDRNGQGGGQGGQNRGTGTGTGGGGFNRGGAGQGQGGGFNRGTGTGGGNRPGAGGNNRPGAGTGRPGVNASGEVDSKEIQRKIQETQARLAGGRGGGKNQKAKYRRDKREMMAEKRAASENGDGNIIQVTEFISVSELANLMDVSFADVISKCMNLGIMVSINQRLDAEVIEMVAEEFGYVASFINLEQEADKETEEEVDDTENQLPRAPIVTIMGHVDHGKTSLLDYIRSANVVAGEAGGITQHIGAYQVLTANDKRITFLDTPGHEAFTAMRARGAKVADIAVIVIAADDAIMPQTKEAISHAQAANLPMIFAINKIDREGANPEKIREQLAGMNILVEEWGGKYQSQEISAKKGLNIDLLLEKINLEAEILDLKANPDRFATGSVIEASLDKGRGYVATILVQNGTLKQGEMIACGQHFGRVKAMLNERGQRVTTAGPSAPVQVLGLNGAPQSGEKFKMYEDENEAKDIATHRAQIMREQGIRARKVLTLDEIGRRLALGNFKELPLIIKGDFDGSVEALSDSLQKLSTPEVAVNVVMKGVGAVTESDINLAVASGAIVIGFQVRPTAQASRLAEQESVEIRTYSIIYDAIEEIKSAMEGLLEPKVEKRVTANVEVREVYKITGVGTIAGAYVLDGKIFRNNKINLIRDGIVVHTGELGSLKRFKDDVKDVNFGYECGISIKNYSDVRVGDVIEGFEEVEVKRTL